LGISNINYDPHPSEENYPLFGCDDNLMKWRDFFEKEKVDFMFDLQSSIYSDLRG